MSKMSTVMYLQSDNSAQVGVSLRRNVKMTLKACVVLFLISCGGGIKSTLATSDPPPPGSPSSSDSESISSNSEPLLDSISSSDSLVDPPLRPISSSVRAVSTRPTSDISTTSGDGGDSVPSHYDVCPNLDPWCSSLDENEKLALEAIHALHHQLDDDKNGNIDLYESNEFLREELKYDKDYEKRQENFHRNNDNQVSVKELWETWVRSEVHNWTTDQTVEWISTFVGLPLYQEKFTQLEINGTFLPRLAVNHHNILTANLGIKDVITRQKLTLKAQDVVLFGPPKDNTNHTKDAILTSLLVVAVTVCYLVYCRYKSSQRDLTRMSKDMEALMKAEETLRDLQKEMEQAKCDQEIRDKEAVTHRGSSDDEDELMKLRDEVIVLRNELQRAEVELQDKCWVPPPALTHWLQLTYELELKAHSKKRQSAEKQLKQAKDACDKLKKKRSSLMGAFVATHARSIDDVDKAILEARAALTEVTQELQERMHRWKQIEMLVKSPIVNNPGLTSLEILLRTGSRAHPYLGTGSVMSNSQDDIDDDGASSIYCQSAVHKLISTSAFMMFPGQNPGSSSRSYQAQQHGANTSSSDYSSLTNYGSGDSLRHSQSPDMGRRADHLHHLHQQQQQQHHQRTTNVTSQSHQCQQNCDCNYHSTTDFFTDSNEVAGPITNIHAPIARSKSVQSMLSLRDQQQRGAYMVTNRESSSKDSSNGEEDLVAGEASEMTAKDRRVTFRNAAVADRRSGQLRAFQGRAGPPGVYEPMEFDEARTGFYTGSRTTKSSRLEGLHGNIHSHNRSSDEESTNSINHSHPRKKQAEEPDLIPYNLHKQHTQTNKHNTKIIEEEDQMEEESPSAQAVYHLPNNRRESATDNLNNNTNKQPQSKLNTDEKSVLSLSLEETPQPASTQKMSLIKKISKIMKFGHDNSNGTTGKRQLLKSFSTNTTSEHHQNTLNQKSSHEKNLNGLNNGSVAGSLKTNSFGRRFNPNTHLSLPEESTDFYPDGNATLPKSKAPKKTINFFSSLRGRKSSKEITSNDTEESSQHHISA